MNIKNKKDIEQVKEELLKELRENTTNTEFLNFAFGWLGEEFIMELLEESINNYEDLEGLEDSLKGLRDGNYELEVDTY